MPPAQGQFADPAAIQQPQQPVYAPPPLPHQQQQQQPQHAMSVPPPAPAPAPERESRRKRSASPRKDRDSRYRPERFQWCTLLHSFFTWRGCYVAVFFNLGYTYWMYRALCSKIKSFMLPTCTSLSSESLSDLSIMYQTLYVPLCHLPDIRSM